MHSEPHDISLLLSFLSLQFRTFRRCDDGEVTERKCSLVTDVQAAALVCQMQHRWRELMVLATAFRLVEYTSSISRLEEARFELGRSVQVRRFSSARSVLVLQVCRVWQPAGKLS